MMLKPVKRRFILPGVLLFMLLALLASPALQARPVRAARGLASNGDCGPATSVAAATGKFSPLLSLKGTRVVNGDFLITNAGPAGVGDGLDMETTWTFDFTGQPTPRALQAALLILTLTPKGDSVSNAVISLEDRPDIHTPLIQNLAVDTTQTIQIDLLAFYAEADILAGLATAPTGQLPMTFRGEVLVSFAQLMLITPAELSPLARQVLARIQARASLANSPVPQELLLTGCNRLEAVLVDGPQIFAAFKDAISQAHHEVDIAFFAWEEESQAAALIGEGLKLALANRQRGDKLVVRLLTDDFLLDDVRIIDRMYNSVKTWKLDPNKIIIQFATHPHAALAALHDKMVVVDSRVLIVTGANAETFHDPPDPWHDTAYVLRGPVALSALASFDDDWSNWAKHWACRPRRFQRDCQNTTHPVPDRSWLAWINAIDAIDRNTAALGTIPIIAIGRQAKNFINNNVQNPQDLAWLTVMENARRNIHVISPNINDDAFRRSILRAAARGVEVRIIAGQAFNKHAENRPGQGSFNQRVIGRLRQRMRQAHRNWRHNLKLCWYSQDGLKPVMGNGPGASHTKFMSVDGQIAIVGSGNMDTQSWNQSHEFNLLFDGPDVVSLLEARFFSDDWARAICQVIEFYEGNNGTHDLVCSKHALHDQVANFLDRTHHCANDEARSLILYETPPGRVFRLYDDPRGSRADDWVEIIVKRPITEKLIGTFERSFEDEDVRVIYHPYNGLDGKVSRFEAASASEP